MQSLTVCLLFPLFFTVHAEVVQQFEKTCNQFFYRGLEPQVQSSSNYVRICQKLGAGQNSYHFATLYDTANRIPVYSGYIYEENNEGGRDPYWMVEPQLVDQNWDQDMMWDGDLQANHPNIPLGERQALNSDYTNIGGYNRGHLNPNQHHTGDSRTATFTLTNAVPQDIALNEHSWNNYETGLINTFRGCNRVYVLVGAVPSTNNWIIKENQNRVNIPDYMWHAFCCLDNKGKPLKSGAAAVRNTNANVVQCSINKLKDFFKKAKLAVHQPFSGNCDAPTSIGDGDCASVVP